MTGDHSYAEAYFILFHAITDAICSLQEAQQKAEQIFIEQQEEPQNREELLKLAYRPYEDMKRAEFPAFSRKTVASTTSLCYNSTQVIKTPAMTEPGSVDAPREGRQEER